jgi:uncharacterized membrane protein
MMQSIGHVFSSVGSGFVKYKQNLFICVLGSALASLSWRLSTNKQSHIAAMEGTHVSICLAFRFFAAAYFVFVRISQRSRVEFNARRAQSVAQ